MDTVQTKRMVVLVPVLVVVVVSVVVVLVVLVLLSIVVVVRLNLFPRFAHKAVAMESPMD